MKIISAIRFATRVHILYPIVGRSFDRALRWVCSQDGWEDIVSAITHALIDSSSAAVARASVVEVMAMVGAYLSPNSVKALQFLDEIMKKHSSEAN